MVTVCWSIVVASAAQHWEKSWGIFSSKKKIKNFEKFFSVFYFIIAHRESVKWRIEGDNESPARRGVIGGDRQGALNNQDSSLTIPGTYLFDTISIKELGAFKGQNM